MLQSFLHRSLRGLRPRWIAGHLHSGDVWPAARSEEPLCWNRFVRRLLRCGEHSVHLSHGDLWNGIM